MKNLLRCFFKLGHPKFVIPAQAGIQVGDMLSLVLFCVGTKNIEFAELRLKVSLRKWLVDWIPACAGMTGLANAGVAI